MTTRDVAAERPLGPGTPGDGAVKRATGRAWADWFEALDEAGGAALDHRGIVGLAVGLGAGDWWAQQVTVVYEQARGKRALHQKPGGFAVSASRTIAVPADRAFEAFTNAQERNRWLPDPVEVSTATPSKSVRLRWHDGSRLSVNLWPKGDERVQVVVQHERLADADAAAKQKARWAERLSALRDQLEGSTR
jgi:hypothetical protein